MYSYYTIFIVLILTEVTVERMTYNSFRCTIKGSDITSPIAIHYPPGTSFGYCKKTESPPCHPEKNLSIDPESTNTRVIVNVSNLTSFGVYQCQYKGIPKNITITGKCYLSLLIFGNIQHA